MEFLFVGVASFPLLPLNRKIPKSIFRLTVIYAKRSFTHMGKSTISRQVVWAQNKRAWLMKVLGSKCARCPSVTCLTFDCIKPRGGAHHKLSSVSRMTFYVREFRQGNLQILCHDCNSRKGANAQERYSIAYTVKLQSPDIWTLPQS